MNNVARFRKFSEYLFGNELRRDEIPPKHLFVVPGGVSFNDCKQWRES